MRSATSRRAVVAAGGAATWRSAWRVVGPRIAASHAARSSPDLSTDCQRT
jgi:hypothetical protein